MEVPSEEKKQVHKIIIHQTDVTVFTLELSLSLSKGCGKRLLIHKGNLRLGGVASWKGWELRYCRVVNYAGTFPASLWLVHWWSTFDFLVQSIFGLIPVLLAWIMTDTLSPIPPVPRGLAMWQSKPDPRAAPQTDSPRSWPDSVLPDKGNSGQTALRSHRRSV